MPSVTKISRFLSKREFVDSVVLIFELIGREKRVKPTSLVNFQETDTYI